MARNVIKPGKKTSGVTDNPQKIKKGKLEARKRKSVQNNKEVKEAGGNYLHTIAFWGLAVLLFLPPYFRGLFFAPEQGEGLDFRCCNSMGCLAVEVAEPGLQLSFPSPGLFRAGFSRHLPYF